MTVSCPDCRSAFRVDPAKVPATGVRARCSVCGGIIAVAGGTGPLRAPARTPVSAGPMVSPSTSQPVFSAPTATPAPMTSGSATVQRPPAAHAAGTPSVGAPVVPTVGASAEPPVAGSAATPRHLTAAPTPMRAMPPAPSSSASLRAVSPAAATATPTASGAATPASATAASATPRRTINPFLNADPGQRARRLARALVSDLVAYHPKKREEGLAQGTLRQLFREDIKKSYEEYVEQVGRELAESSPHFQDALNDVLAGGQRMF